MTMDHDPVKRILQPTGDLGEDLTTTCATPVSWGES